MRLWRIEVFFIEFIGLAHDFRELLFEFGKIGTHLIEFDGWIGINNWFVALSIKLIVYLSIREIGLESWRFELRLNGIGIFHGEWEIVVEFNVVAGSKCGRIGIIGMAKIRGEMWVGRGHSWEVYILCVLFNLFPLNLILKQKRNESLNI